MNWYKIAQHGEWWIIDGQATYADGDTGEMGHEEVVLDSLRREIAEHLGMWDLDDHYDWDEVKQSCVRIYFQKQSEEDRENILQKWEVADEEELIEKVPYDTDIFDTIAQEEGMDKFKIDVADNASDPRDYGMKVLGWKRVAGSNIQTWTLTSNDLRSISSGIDDILGGESGDPKYTIEVMATKKVYSDVPASVIENLNPMALREYQWSYRTYASKLGWYKIAILIDKGVGPEELYVQCMNCERWASSPMGDDSQRIWKSLDDMDPEEKSTAIRAFEAKDTINDFLGVSHGLCDQCMEDMMLEGRKRRERIDQDELV